MKNKRACGVLCPIFSLPSPYGIGTFGKDAYEFADKLKKAKQSYWQILPLGPTGYGDSPYQSFSTYAGNPYFIDLDILREDGLLTITECEEVSVSANPADIDYESMYYTRFPVLKKAFTRFNPALDKRYDEFVKANAFWVNDYALYMAVKDSFGGKSFIEWDEDIRLRKKKAVARYSEELKDEIAFYIFLQFEFFIQWKNLKSYVNSLGIKIIGDIPIYVAYDSADVWGSPELFMLDDELKPINVAGCPPDQFAELGQLWGNPLYDWKKNKATGYKWWIRRISKCFELYDVVRIDHFRGFESYYAIPFGDEDATGGHWEKGPGYDLFAAIKKELGDVNVIAEDLGFLTKKVRDLVKKTGYPGMKVLQFAFNDYRDSEYLPHRIPANSVVYTGTHDNETTYGYTKNLRKKDASFMKQYYGLERIVSDEDTDAEMILALQLVRSAMMCNADTAIIPIQDYLLLDNDARINVPSTLGTNWRWRMLSGEFTDETIKQMKRLARISFRAGKYAKKPSKKKEGKKSDKDKKKESDE